MKWQNGGFQCIKSILRIKFKKEIKGGQKTENREKWVANSDAVHYSDIVQ